MRPGDPDAGPASGGRATPASLAAMNWLNFLTALMQTAFGAFLSVYLTTNGWSATDIGVVLAVGTVVAIACQIPGACCWTGCTGRGLPRRSPSPPSWPPPP